MNAVRRLFGMVIAVFASVALLAGAGQQPAQPGKASPPPPIERPANPTVTDVRTEATETAAKLKKLAEQYQAEWEKNPDNARLLGRFPREMRADLAEYQGRLRKLLAGAPGGAGPVVADAKAAAVPTVAGKGPTAAELPSREKLAGLTGQTHLNPGPALAQAAKRDALLRELDRSADRIKGELEKLTAAMKESKPDQIKERFKALVEAIDGLAKVAKAEKD
jgi:hypothetical protein